jgi:hypothetical protein
MSNYQPPPPPPAPAPWLQPQYVDVEPGKGLAVAALVCGIVGSIFGLIPITSLVALAAGVTAVVLGAIAWRKRSRAHVRRTMAAWGIALGVLAVGLGSWGMYIVQDTVNEIDREFQQFDDESYTPPSAAEIDQASDNELQEMWWEAPSDSDSEARIQAELESRGL